MFDMNWTWPQNQSFLSTKNKKESLLLNMILISDVRDSKKLMFKHIDCQFVIDRQYCTEQKMGVQNLGSFILQAHTHTPIKTCILVC